MRARTGGDLDGCVRILAEVHTADGYPLNWPAAPGTWLTPPAHTASWVAELDGRVAGHAALCHATPDDAAPTAWSAHTGSPTTATAVLSRLFVAPWARGHGLGALLLTRATAAARDRALHPVLDVLTSDTAAAHLYARLGWHHLATVTQHWSPAQQVTVDCWAAPGHRAIGYRPPSAGRPQGRGAEAGERGDGDEFPPRGHGGHAGDGRGGR
ncbi:GNAT family N-acetyltransferase [Streptomyces sp. NPDC058045]|uniref:GNAT family N-acetyltransferase n=1 Tax=Streptomyces sp. NPDC058045 TaxID=3346311 RepID=UPI0036EDC4A7